MAIDTNDWDFGFAYLKHVSNTCDKRIMKVFATSRYLIGLVSWSIAGIIWHALCKPH